MGDEQYRPWDMTVGDDGKVYEVSGAAYGKLGGAITAIDPQTETMESWRYLAGDQNLFAVAPGHGEVYVGTTDHGDGIDATGDAQLLAFDEATHTVTYRTVPVPDSHWIVALATAPDGTVFGSTGEGQWFTFDPATRTVTQLGAFPLGVALGLGVGPDGLIYGHTADSIFRIDPTTRQVERIAATTADTRYRTQAFDAQGRLYWGSGPDLMRMTP